MEKKVKVMTRIMKVNDNGEHEEHDGQEKVMVLKMMNVMK